MKNKWTANIGLKIASVFFSIVLWMVGNSIGNPTISQSFYNIPVELENTEAITDSGRVYEVLDDTDVINKVVIRGPRSIVSSLSSENIVATADVSSISSLDTVSIRVTTDVHQDQINSITSSSDTVKLRIDNKKTKALALSTKITGSVTEGYMVGDIVTDQNLVRLSGPESVVDTITKAVAEIDVSGFTGDIGTSAEIKLYDAGGNVVSDASINQNIKSVGVKVTILQTKDVPVIFSTQGEPTMGYQETGVIETDKETIRLSGKSSVLKNIDSIEIPSEVIDVTGRKDTFSMDVDIRSYLPENVQLVQSEDAQIHVTVYIEAETAKRLELKDSSIVVTNLPDGFEASVSGVEETFIIELIGLSKELDHYQANSMMGTIDTEQIIKNYQLDELKEGFYNMEVDFGLTDDVRLLEPVEVVVHISKK